MPKGAVNPFALKVLQSHGYPIDGLASKSWQTFGEAAAPRMDLVLTGSDTDKERAFNTAFRYLKNRISLLANLPMASPSKLALERKLQDIGRIEGSISRNPKVA